MTQGLPILTKWTTYICRNAGGAIDPFLGFWPVKLHRNGSHGRPSIANGDDYERLLKRVTKHNQQLYQMRKAFNTADNDTYDSLLLP